MTEQIRLIQHGEPLTPEVANRPIKDLARLLSDLLRQVQNLSDTANNVLENQPLDETVHVGAPVYFNKATGRYSRARVCSRVEGDQIVCDDPAYVIGVVVRKHAATVGDICLGGVVTVDLEEGGNQDAQQDYQELGLKWLSVLDGRLTDNPPSLAIPVAFVLEVGADGKVRICVCVNFDRVLSGHRHLKYELKARPSGTWLQEAPDITYVQSAMEGWLPVSEFQDVDIPSGAKYGYNLGASSFANQFPLIAPSTFQVHWGQFTNDYDPLPVVGEISEKLLVVNEDGIWWMSDEYLPWYKETNWNNGVPIDPATPLAQSMVAYYTQVTYNTTDAVVTSLDSEPGSGLTVSNRFTGAPAMRGDLRLSLDFETKRASDVYGGVLALKTVGAGYMNQRHPDDVSGEAIKNGFFFGPVVESLELDSVGSELLSWSDSEKRWVELGSGYETATWDGKLSGRLLLRTGDAWGNLPLPVQAVHLDQMRDAYIGGMAAISFMPGSRSGFSGSIYLPWFRHLTAKARIRLTFVAGATGSVSSAAFTGRYTVIPAVPCDNNAYPLPTLAPSLCEPGGGSGDLGFNFAVSVTVPQSYFCATSEPIEVSPGAMVWFSLHKEPGGFTGALSVIRMEAFLDTEP